MADSAVNIEKRHDGTALLALAGEWKLGKPVPSDDTVLEELLREKVDGVSFDAGALLSWDSTLLVFLNSIFHACRGNGIPVDESGLPEGVRQLMRLAAPENQRSGLAQVKEREPLLARLGGVALRQVEGTRYVLGFIGDIVVALLKMLRGRSDFRRVDLVLTIEETGAQALPIVTLISLLIGMILAFIAAIQLRLFGAQIYVADVVGIGVVRVMGAVMVGVIMAGRSGAAFAAQLGTMQVNEEIDALETLGVSAVDFLVLPRLLALTLMMPLLCLYADLMGMLGGMIVGVGMLRIGAMEYVIETRTALSLNHFWVGLIHSFVFGILVAGSGCLRGIQCERSASAVGYATTSAVVTAIVSMVIATFVITFVCQVLGV
jgi:phospholipid/cholesterol/gamma-HCH transport system permease protein